ncbi:CHAP domain-containing protein [Actinomadura sp. CNU-125]|uniref:CHAP domain-containing protein n=1 Tax=Actinomadura sp. CNU-125 TaxID=1904961 RepID=UPI0021CCAF63|nr:CHAP domain-containing protein [Actinomadura sp. CNU-125]
MKRLNPQSAVKRLAPELAIKRWTPEDRAVGVAVGAVLAGAVGLSVFSPVAGASAATEAVSATAEKAAAVTHTVEKPEATSSGMTLAEAKAEGWKVLPRAVEASEVIDLAKEQVGIEEEGSGNMTKFHDWWVSTPRAESAASSGGFSVDAYKGAAWCDMFVSWLGSQTGVKGMGWDAYTVSHANWFKDQGRWGDEAKPGAIVFFDWGAGSDGSIGDIDHVGIVEKDNGDGTVSTIEGNSNNAVQERTRDKGQIVGYGYPEYA